MDAAPPTPSTRAAPSRGCARRSTSQLATKAGSAFLAGAALFVLLGVATPIRDHPVPIVLVGVAFLYLIFAVAKRFGPLYAVPVAIAGGLAFDSFFIPPTRSFAASDWDNWLVVVIYISMGVLIGMLGEWSVERAEASERARGRLADEHAALRRVATLVARNVPSGEVFAAVAREVGQLLDVDVAYIGRYERDGTVTAVAEWGDPPPHPVGTRVRMEGESVSTFVRQTERPARLDDYSTASGPMGTIAREGGVRSAAGSPIVVEGRVWGVILAASKTEPLPADTEGRIEEFTELVAAAISNIEARSDLAASRARIVAAADDERRRVVRDLHDGAQQRLVHTVVTLKLARRALERGEDTGPALVSEALDQAQSAMVELRELSHGIIPSVLTWGGLSAGVEALASRMPVPVDVDVKVGRFSAAIEASAYFVVAEALTNVAKHSHANRAAVAARVQDSTLELQIEDDGTGAADPNGPGLLGLADRVASLDGALRIVSVPDEGTKVIATFPLT